MAKTTKPGIISQIGHDVAVKIGVAVIMFIAGALLSVFMAMNSGSKDGTHALKENIEQQEQIDTIRKCQIVDRAIIQQIITKQNLYYEEQKEMFNRMDKRIEVLYINELEGNR